MLKKKVLTGVIIGCLLGLTGATVTYLRPSVLESMELATYDMRVRAVAQPEDADPRIVLINIDDSDLAWVKRGAAGEPLGWPWPREFYGMVTRYLFQEGAAAVAYDLIFAARNANPSQDEAFAKALAATSRTVIGLELTRYEWRHRAPGRVMARLATFARCDAPEARKLADKMAWYQLRVVLLPTSNKCTLWAGGTHSPAALREMLHALAKGGVLEENVVRKAKIRQLPQRAFARELDVHRIAKEKAALPVDPDGGVPAPSYPLLRAPSLPLVRSARYLGVVKQTPDPDGVFRHYAPVMHHRGKLYPSLALAAAMAALPKRRLSVQGGRLRWGHVTLPRADHGRVAIRFHGPRETYSTVGIRHILNVLAQRSEHKEYERRRTELAQKLLGAVKDDARLPQQVRTTLVALWRRFQSEGCTVRTTGPLTLLAQIPARPTWHTLRVQRAAEALAHARIPAHCRTLAQRALERIRTLRRRFNQNPQRVRGLIGQARDLAVPAPCRQEALSALGRLQKIMSLQKAAPKRALAAAQRWRSLLESARCTPRVIDTFRRELLRTDLRYPKRFQRFPHLRPGEPKGRIFIVNAAAAGLRDIKPSPVDDLHLGGEINATFLDNLLHGDFVTRCDRWTVALITLLLCVLLGCGTFLIIALTRSALWVTVLSLLASITVVGAYGAAAFLALKEYLIWLDAVGPSLFAGLTWVASLAANFYTEGKSRRFVQDALGRYTSPVLVRELMARPERLSLDFGEERELTVFFSDLQGFTSISERLSPGQLVHLLNEYLTEMTDIILEEGGIVDKYIGDAVMAFWGAPHDDPDHALRACRATIRMQARLRELRPRWQADYGEVIIARCGLNSGLAVAGNMGSRHKFNYTLMGDTVNLASRLEGANKPYGTVSMMGQSTYARVKDHVVARELDLLAVKGKDEPVRVYELIGFREDVPPAEQERVERFHHALDVYRQTKFQEAMELFQQIIKDFDGDGPSRLYISRCRDYLRNPPPLDWDGVFRMTTK